jgi:sugar/nucleoside kinase (ribokinase family)
MSEHYGTPPDYLIIGHVTMDLLPGGQGYAPGGTVTYSALAAARLGAQVAVVTACKPEDDWVLDVARAEGVWVHALPSPHTTIFRNVYDEHGHRTQFIKAQARALRYEDVPKAWGAAPIVHLGPVAQELPPDMPGRFPNCLLGVTPQGWMRSWDGDGMVRHSARPVPLALRDLPPNTFLVLSIEDLGYDPALVDVYTRLAPLVVITQEARDALVSDRGRRTAVPAYPARVLDPTGAGDIFAAALFVRYRETGDLVQAVRFAHAAAACAIEGPGFSTIPNKNTVELRMRNFASWA